MSLVQMQLDPDHRGSESLQQGAGLELIDHALYPHEGDPKQTLLKAFEKLDLNATSLSSMRLKKLYLSGKRNIPKRVKFG